MTESDKATRCCCGSRRMLRGYGLWVQANGGGVRLEGNDLLGHERDLCMHHSGDTAFIYDAMR